MVRPAAVTGNDDTRSEALRLDAVCRERAASEIASAEALARADGGVRGQGDVLAEILLLKGAPGPDDLRTRRALSGEDGVAIGKALDALGLPKERFAFCTSASGSAAKSAGRVRLLVEAVDPRIVVLLDPRAAADFARAFAVDVPSAGVVVRVLGRDVIALDDFAASLADEQAKRHVWRQLQALSAKGA